jgi:hypothetical protein
MVVTDTDVHLDALRQLVSTAFMHCCDHACIRNSERQKGVVLDVHGLPSGWAVAGDAEGRLQVLDEKLHLFEFAVNEDSGSWLHLIHEVDYSFGICV